MATLLFGIGTHDLVTFAIVPLVLGLSALLAVYVPALRATRVDPVVALREE
jgi:ABC-type lipoprotein release transport system permease subunit